MEAIGTFEEIRAHTEWKEILSDSRSAEEKSVNAILEMDQNVFDAEQPTVLSERPSSTFLCAEEVYAYIYIILDNNRNERY